MITLTPDDVKQRFGPLFSKKFLVMVDEKAGLAEILEQCHARGTIEWDAMNRSRAGGAVAACAVEGSDNDHPGSPRSPPRQFRGSSRVLLAGRRWKRWT